jgi:uroporphyrinogen decarboxylase
MYRIRKARETMTGKERVRLTFNFEKADRVPIDYETNPTINRRFMAALGFRDEERDAFRDALGVDYRGIDAPYIGPKLFPDVPGLNCDPLYGFYSRWVENRFGGYFDFCNFPLKDADEEKIAAFPTPNPDDFDYSRVAERVKRTRDYAVFVGSAGQPDIINSLGRVMGMEDTLVNLQLGDEATLGLMKRKTDFEREKLARLLEAIKKAGGEPDFMWLGEDLGTQIAPMIGCELFDRVFRPVFQSFIDLAKAYGIPVMVHTCGSSSWVYERFIQMGVRAVDTLQPEAADMSPRYLLDHFGGRLNFHGCISTAMLANESADGVTAVCRDTLRLLMPTRGYHFAPTHAIQDNTPVENLVAMYQAAHDYGGYGS